MNFFRSRPRMAFSSFSSTSALVSRTASPSSMSAASNDRSSITRSITVYSRRAPMFSTLLLISAARFAISRIASSSISRVTPSAFISAFCCSSKFARGSVRIRYRSSAVRPLSSTRIGSRPCSSASMSDGLDAWKAPEQTKSTWSVLTGPYLRTSTVVPSMSGSRSRCTPSSEASPPRIFVRSGTILSISSMTTMPCCSASRTASFFTSSACSRFCSSASSRSGRASSTLSLRVCVRAFAPGFMRERSSLASNTIDWPPGRATSMVPSRSATGSST
mmetsp:Transcript_25841/g.97323  ORF Transcript_25841/g.97323 Transcript_25841/m.97323 type:complete len:276 (+) Transcript_25841:96-923(+)